MLIDSHCHLDFPAFDDDRDQVIDRARAAGVEKIISIGTRLSAFDNLLALLASYDQVYGSVGIHPLNVESEEKASVERLLLAAEHPKIVAIGEAGLDHHYDKSTHDLQVESLLVHIEASRQSALPLVVHARDADDALATLLREAYEEAPFKAVMHCYASGASLARVALDLGFYLSFSGIVTFKNAESIRLIAAEVPKERLLVETDAPYLAPVPNRGKRNEPAFVRDTADALASLRQMEPEALIELTGQNTLRLFDKMVSS